MNNAKTYPDDSAYLAGLDAASNQISTTDVSWEAQFDKIVLPDSDGHNHGSYEVLKSFIRKQIDLAFDEGYAARGGVESEQKQRMLEAGKGVGRKEAIDAVKDWVKNNYHQDIHVSANFGMHTKKDIIHLSDFLNALEALSNK